MATTKAYALGRLGNKLSVDGTDVGIGGKIKTEISAPVITIDASNATGRAVTGIELLPDSGLENAMKMKKKFTPEKGKREIERGKWSRVIASKSRYITAVFLL